MTGGVFLRAYLSALAIRLENTVFISRGCTGMAGRPAARPLAPREHPHPCGPDILCSARSLAFRIEHGQTTDETTVAPARLVGYECGELATVLFIAGLLDHLARCRGLADSEFGRFADVAEFTPVVGPEDVTLA